jgi:rubrerythrin
MAGSPTDVPAVSKASIALNGPPGEYGIKGGGMPERYNVIEALDAAYRTEVAGHMFYTAAAAMAGDEKGRNVFAHLAKEEFDHIKVISSIAESVKSGNGWRDYDSALNAAGTGRAEGLPVSPPAFPGENELTKRLQRNPSDANAVQIGIESEEAAVEFYSRLLKDASAPIEKVVLTRLLEMEKGHLKMLRWESESLAKTGFWCGVMEYSVEKEVD